MSFNQPKFTFIIPLFPPSTMLVHKESATLPWIKQHCKEEVVEFMKFLFSIRNKGVVVPNILMKMWIHVTKQFIVACPTFTYRINREGTKMSYDYLWGCDFLSWSTQENFETKLFTQVCFVLLWFFLFVCSFLCLILIINIFALSVKIIFDTWSVHQYHTPMIGSVVHKPNQG